MRQTEKTFLKNPNLTVQGKASLRKATPNLGLK
jgi:hypothetical protein